MRHVRQRPTIDDVARRAKVSIATVSRVLNQSAPVGDEAAARVRVAVAELDYRPASAAQVLATRKTNAVGLILSRISGDYFAPLLRGIEAEVAAAGMNLLISSGGPRGGAALAEHNTDGLLIFADSLDPDENSPVVATRPPARTSPSHTARRDGDPLVTVENKSGARQLVDHLIEVHGHRRIAYLRGPAGHEDSDWRELGYRKSLASHGLDGEAALTGQGDFSATVAEAQVAVWLTEEILVEAIFAGDDAAAVGALRAVHAAGYAGRIGVVGFDDVALARHLSPPLTTVSAPTEDVGREAVRELVHWRRGEPTRSLVLLPTQLVVRQSCGCVNSELDQEIR